MIPPSEFEFAGILTRGMGVGRRGEIRNPKSETNCESGKGEIRKEERIFCSS
jgi:hypothetical protein